MTKLSLLSDLSKLSILIWKYTKKLPKEENYVLLPQIRRAVLSVRLNIREGNSFPKNKKLNFFRIAFGSLNEVEECIKTMEDLGYLKEGDKEEFYMIYWLCLNKLKKLIASIDQ